MSGRLPGKPRGPKPEAPWSYPGYIEITDEEIFKVRQTIAERFDNPDDELHVLDMLGLL